MTPETLESQFRWLVTELYGEEFTAERHGKFRERQAALPASRSREEATHYERHAG
jgi:hypothetical protein